MPVNVLGKTPKIARDGANSSWDELPLRERIAAILKEEAPPLPVAKNGGGFPLRELNGDVFARRTQTTGFTVEARKGAGRKNSSLALTKDAQLRQIPPYVPPAKVREALERGDGTQVKESENTYVDHNGWTKTDYRYISAEGYERLIKDLRDPAASRKKRSKPVAVAGEVRYHYMAENKSPRWNGNSGVRTRVGLYVPVYENWTVYGLLEGMNDIKNYQNKFEFSRINLYGKLGVASVSAGSFGQLIAEGNIYDSNIDGGRVSVGQPVNYTMIYGETDYVRNFSAATARYEHYNYSFEAGIYDYKIKSAANERNTIYNAIAAYETGGFTFSAMYMRARLPDRSGGKNGYVASVYYGRLRSWIPHTYVIFAKYYNQARHTYIAHGMFGLGPWMDGFKGYGAGVNYMMTKNLMATAEYYSLKENGTGDRGKSVWLSLSYFF
jgi:hypothetical protein